MDPQAVSYTSTVTEEQSVPSIGVVDNWRTDSLVHSVVLWLALMAVQRAVGFLRAILFCRWLDVGQLGLWDMTFGFLMLAGPLAMLALPGTFGRYAEYYRLRGQLRPFLARTAAACILLTLAAVTLIVLFRDEFSRLIFGSSRQTELVILTAGVLIAVAAYNYFISLLTALRIVRLAATMEFLNGVLFAALGIGLLLTWRCDSASVVMAYGGSCLLSIAAVSWQVKAAWKSSPADIEPLPRRSMWSKLIPFAAWILSINMLTNLFGIADRYMIIHFATGPVEERLALVGQYYSSRVLPLLLVSVASMMATVLLPHLCHDWESGRRDQVARRLNLFLKLLAFGLMAASGAVLFVAPWLFGVAFQGKFAAGMAVLPWTLAYCVCFGVAVVAQQYLWCAERASLVGLALGAGLAVNIALNLALLPRLGLLGAVLAASAANLIALVLILVFARLAGFQIHRGLWIILGLAPAICLGPWVTLGVLLVIALETIRSDKLLTREEKHQLSESIKHYWSNFIKGLSRLPSPFGRGAGGEGHYKP
jgi:O-antigen/teichoic acid export membrane protein